MPELPEVETVKRGLETKLRKRSVRKVDVLRSESIAHPSAKQFAQQVKGRTFSDIERRGKYLLFGFDDGSQMGAHLRMSGRLLVIDPKSSRQASIREEHVRVRLDLDNGHQLVFEDMRVFGRLWFIPSGVAAEDVVSGLAELGVEPLSRDFTARYLFEVLRNRKQPIKSALLDQTLIAGIGNIYADESLHLSGIHPQHPARDLTLEQVTLLCKQIKNVLERAIQKRGSTLRNYTDSDGVNGNYQSISNVYGRTGSACRQCKTKIERIRLAGRSSHFCPSCQKLKR